ncbi:hypothetical protein PCIT_a2530 [Pseudoalteromonas citrea]|uniref:Tox-PAAR-like domain-containing protein n=2 Tax=Pseudoalteromonas citrea TaxID=43655 RepID=A0AAD4FRC6_9GAMM|nr:DUF4150 domain-containing protein [Pseudoalteromonas citrea]KAF7769661.1 hypothetical protein PCIT_a2530 [Pseudoalteromonas citrea]
MTYINASVGEQPNTVQYDKDAMTADVRSGGSQTWRTNNPTLLGLTHCARQNGALGQVGGVAIFDDKSAGEAAFMAELQRPKYQGLSYGELVFEFLPDHVIAPPVWNEQDNEPQLPWQDPETGMDVNMPISSPRDFLDFVASKLGWQQGSEQELKKDTTQEQAQVNTVSGDNLLINGKTAVHVNSGGKVTTVDVCNTTIPMVGVVPIPYANVAKAEDLTDVAESVKIAGNGTAHIRCTFSESKGDSPGDKKGIVSSTVEKKAEFISASFNVLVEGKPAVRQGDLMISNNKNTPPSPLSQPGGAKPSPLTIELREAADLKTDHIQAGFTVTRGSSTTSLDQGGFELRQGAFVTQQKVDKGV